MADDQGKETLTESWLRSLKNYRVIAAILVVGAVIAGIANFTTEIASFTESVEKLFTLLVGDPEKPGVTKNIFAECNIGLWPPTIPQSGKIYFAHIQSISSPGSGLGYFFGEPGKEASGFGAYKATYECKVTNYSTMPVFDVKISLYLTFRKAITLPPPDPPTARRSGAIKATLERPLVIPKIDAGKENPFAFYIISFSKDFIDVSLPRTITLRQGADQAEHTAPLNQPSHYLILLMPFNEDK